ncbi:MAG: malate synthase G [Acidimicrobiia bacterium]|nr:malate synthase G [Acidimicrobiia bacterium]
MTSAITEADLQIGAPLHAFLVNEALPGSGVDRDEFFSGLSHLIHKFGPRNAELLAVRQDVQNAIDSWHRDRADAPHDPVAYRAFLEELGYLVPGGDEFEIQTTNIDAEIALQPGPQLVVPVMNARYAINAANARWGSLYDALYGTDVLGDLPQAGPYSPERGTRVVDWARAHLDEAVPLARGSHAGSTNYAIHDGAVIVTTADGATTPLADPSQFAGYEGPVESPLGILLRQNGLGIDLRFDPDHPVGSQDTAGISDVVLESAITAIMDCEDSVAAVDAQDKALGYHNWLGLMNGTLTEEVTKNGETFTRSLQKNFTYSAPDGSPLELPGRALMFVRNVGHLMTTPAVLDSTGNEVPEGLLDAMITTLCATHDVRGSGPANNSSAGSIYVVKPKMHGPEEVAFADEVFTFVEGVLGLPANTVKLGIMDEERRTTINLAECIRAAKSRVAFINTGFLDRTGDEIHTSMEAGPMVRKSEMKSQPWIGAYEDWNVDVGLRCGLRGRAQIGKGMWAAPDLMADMVSQKIGHPQSGANCAWVPSPTAATLHALHYHHVDVLDVQRNLEGHPRATLDDILSIPLATDTSWSAEDVQAELDNNAQGILGYVVRWVDAGIGCSKVPDINDVGLMEDRATCRISSQHMANWLRHGIVDEAQVRATMEAMAIKVDAQNAHDPSYRPMAPDYTGHAYQAACDLVFSGVEQPSGYTEPILHAHRLALKADDQATS